MKKILALLCCVAVALGAAAVPARRGLIPAVQPDGSTVMIQAVGDEHNNFILDADGNLLTNIDGYYRFGALDASGAVVESATPVKLDIRSAITLRREARTRTAAAAGSRAASVAPDYGLFPGATFPLTGKQKALVVLVEFPDQPFKLGAEEAHRYFTDLLNKDGFSEHNATGSAHEYFMDSSSGKFDCQFDVYGPVKLAHEMKYYGAPAGAQYDSRPHMMALEACQALDATVDFREYDRNNDGKIDNIYIFYAGYGQATRSDLPNTIWPHAYYVTQALAVEEANKTHYYFDGVLLDSYGCTNEWEDKFGVNGLGQTVKVGEAPAGIGTFVHEFCHILGLPDLYNIYDNTAPYTPADWSVLDYGPYNNDGRTPPSMSSYERNALGWLESEILGRKDYGDYTLTDIQASNHAYCVVNPDNDKDFYLLEARRRTSWDKYLPGEGMLIWHIDYDEATWALNEVNTSSANTYASHQRVDLCEADGIASKTWRDAGDIFPGSERVSTYVPRWWDRSLSNSGFRFTDIALNADKTVSFTLPHPPGGQKGYLTVAEALEGNDNGVFATLRGYVVGFLFGSTYNQASLRLNTVEKAPIANVLLADSPDETDAARIIPVQFKSSIPYSQACRTLNLRQNPEVLGKYVEVDGELGSYYKTPVALTLAQTAVVEPASSITEVEGGGGAGADDADPYYYDLSGRRFPSPSAPGVYIHRGHKILIR